MSIKVLWVSSFAPYDSVPHAGGQIHNYYLKELIKNQEFDVSLVTFCKSEEELKVREDLKKYNIKNTLIVFDHKLTFDNILRRLYFIESRRNLFTRYAGITNGYYYRRIKRILDLEYSDYEPDIIILQWTQVILFIDLIRKLFPNASIVVIEEDVSYLSYERKASVEKKAYGKFKLNLLYRRLKLIELDALKKSNLIILNNEKDRKLLLDEGIDKNKTWVWSPFFHNYSYVSRNKVKSKDILFYGAMNRRENYLSALWFIENVMPKLQDEGFRFIVAGNKPHESLQSKNNKSIIVTGFVDDIGAYFSNSLCLVAPLVLGAGIKIKILEAMSSGIPVLTNSIGIEGIKAVNYQDYVFCESPEEYVSNIRRLSENKNDRYLINGKSFINENYNYASDANRFSLILQDIYRSTVVNKRS